jgi:hypothetical protein
MKVDSGLTLKGRSPIKMMENVHRFWISISGTGSGEGSKMCWNFFRIFGTESCNGYPKSFLGNKKIQILTVTTIWRGIDSWNGNSIFLLLHVI